MAAAALYALRHNVERLVEDHRNARALAAGLAGIDGLAVALDTVQTNMVYVEVEEGAGRAARLIEQLGESGVRAWNLGRRLRFVTSMLVDNTDCDYAVAAVAKAMSAA